MPTKTSTQWHFFGGLKLDSHKAQSTSRPIATANLPRRLLVPLQQHIGEPGLVCVSVGDSVLKGQALSEVNSYVSAPVHAPSSGKIISIDEHPVPHPSGLSALCIEIETDGEDRWIELQPLTDPLALAPSELRQHIRQLGIVGLGGATFPTAVKVNSGPDAQVDTLIINGAECEPYISCDDMLMREQAEKIVKGSQLIQHIAQARQCIIAIEDNKPEAIAAITQALACLASQDIQVASIPTLYPTGSEKQLIKVLTNKEVPSDGLPADIGLLVQNVGTAEAVYNALYLGQPMVSRIVTITGKGVKQPQNIRVLMGTPMSELIEQSGGYTEQAQRLIMGGPMMGFALGSDQLPVSKGCNCLLVDDTPVEAASTLPCIRCGACANVCPAQLLPQQLYWQASSKNFDLVQDYHLFDCIECGCCAYVCPSQIPLVQYFRFAKTEIWNQERERLKSDHARVRHDFRQSRLEREKKEREEKLRKKKEMLEKKKQEEAAARADQGNSPDNSPGNNVDPKKAAIEAAMQRVQAKKAAQQDRPQNPTQDSPGAEEQ